MAAPGAAVMNFRERASGAMSFQEQTPGQGLAAGIDIGSTTTKVAVLDLEKGKLLYSDYKRHHADQAASVMGLMEDLEHAFPGEAVIP